MSLRQGHHQGLIDWTTYQMIQERLNGIAKAPMRKDINADFPFRGFVVCGCCDKPLTASWSKSNTGKRHPYYWCKTKGCSEHRKSIRRDALEGDMHAVLQSLQPHQSYTRLIGKMFKDAWTVRLGQSQQRTKAAQAALRKTETQIDGLLDRIVEATQPSVIAAYEKRIAALEEEKLKLAENLTRSTQKPKAYEEMYELALRFLSNPWDIWVKGDLTWKRTVLKLVFAAPVGYCREKGIRTPENTLPFKALRGFYEGKSSMARWGGLKQCHGLNGLRCNQPRRRRHIDQWVSATSAT